MNWKDEEKNKQQQMQSESTNRPHNRTHNNGEKRIVLDVRTERNVNVNFGFENKAREIIFIKAMTKNNKANGIQRKIRLFLMICCWWFALIQLRNGRAFQ